MGLSFSNPAGFWALLGIPAVLLIHFLQRRAKVLPISTLFLLDQLNRESVSGRNFERIRSSIPLWLQLLMVVLLAWLLAGPRWLQKNSLQRVVVVLDGSASMASYKPRLEEALAKELGRLSTGVATTEYTLMDTLLEKETIYHGVSTEALLAAVKSWAPFSGSHDPARALRVARSLVSSNGVVVFATDHVLADLPSGAKLLAVGEARENVGFAGMTVEKRDGQYLWKATLKNYGSSPQTRQWWVESDGIAAQKSSVSLPPGGSKAVQGAFPNGAKSIGLKCEGDAFAFDDTMLLLAPVPKRLTVALPAAGSATPGEERLYGQIFESLPDVGIGSAAGANIQISHYDPLKPFVADRPGIVFLRDSRSEAPWLTGAILAESHPLMLGLNWQSLICQDAAAMTPKDSDEVLLWVGSRAAIFLRGEPGRRSLCFNIDLKKSNARKLPAFVILIHRYVESVRGEIPLFAAENVECGQKLNLACEQGASAPEVVVTWQENGRERVRRVPPGQISLVHAPPAPGLFKVVQGTKDLFSGAAHFADTREADLSKASSRSDLSGVKASMVEQFSSEERHWRLWVLLLLGVLVVSWYYVKKSSEKGLNPPSREGRVNA